MTAIDAVLAVAGIALVLYAVLGGADFGGGVWNLLATGPRAQEQRDAITHAIGPVWEANHVWLIFIVVLSFTCFPAAYADVTVGLYVPLSLALVGIVLRGAAFVFRNFAIDAPRVARLLSVVFGVASLLAPFALGDATGALATGRYAWLSPFALSIGLFAVTIFAQTAAVFLLLEVDDATVRADFRRRAVRSTLAVWVVGLIPLLAAALTERRLFASFGTGMALGAIACAVMAGIVVVFCVLTGRDGWARAAVVVESAAILAGWFGAQAPYLIPGRFTYAQAASSDAMIVAFLIATGTGFVVLIPSLLLLFRVFKSARNVAGG